MAKQKKTTKSEKNYLVPYSKGLEMTAAMLRNPGKFTNRVVVAYDKNKQTKPRVYVLIGNHDHTNEHQIRRAYSKTVRINYLDSRVILYNTYERYLRDGKTIFEKKRRQTV